jgi:hypothetical protein
LLGSLPRAEPARTVAKAALIEAASDCVAAPGHTAQPFQPTRTAKKFLAAAWGRDIASVAKSAFVKTSALHARRKGTATVCDANEAVSILRRGDLVFIDPPYTGAHYSRFYHVLETLARGSCGNVTGVGRYPSLHERPSSRYSIPSEASRALDGLLQSIAVRGANAILTFPAHRCSNGLSGRKVRAIARKHFKVTEEHVISNFSSLGGTGNGARKHKAAKRQARKKAKELILVLTPKGQRRRRQGSCV